LEAPLPFRRGSYFDVDRTFDPAVKMESKNEARDFDFWLMVVKWR